MKYEKDLYKETKRRLKMKKTTIIILFSILVLLVGCASMGTVNSYQNNVTFQKKIKLMNYDGKPISNTDVIVKIIVTKHFINAVSGDKESGFKKIGEKEINTQTDEEGNLFFNEFIDLEKTESVYIDSYNYWTYVEGNYFEIIINANGYYQKDIDKFESSNEIYLVNKDNHDFYSQDFLSNKYNGKIKADIDSFLGQILKDGFISNSLLEIHSIDLEMFKKQKYITLSLDNQITYNNLKLNKYDIGEKLYDEVIRKMLNNFLIILENEIVNGVSINVFAYTKNLANEYEEKEKIKYKFIMPKNYILKYKNLDITGQELLNNSYILMNDERIQLKLQ